MRTLEPGDPVIAVVRWPYNFPARVVEVDGDMVTVEHERDRTRYTGSRATLIDLQDDADRVRLTELAN